MQRILARAKSARLAMENACVSSSNPIDKKKLPFHVIMPIRGIKNANNLIIPLKLISGMDGRFSTVCRLTKMQLINQSAHHFQIYTFFFVDPNGHIFINSIEFFK
jgi:hypothetical protein